MIAGRTARLAQGGEAMGRVPFWQGRRPDRARIIEMTTDRGIMTIPLVDGPA